MFKRRTIRKSGRSRRRQKSLRPRNSFKARRKEKVQVQNTDILEGMSKLDTTKNDLFYSDTTATLPYPWTDVHPSMKLNSNERVSSMLTLKQICADKIATEVDSLDASNLDQVPESLCLVIWNRILELNNDSFSVYTMFANRFSETRVEGYTSHDFYSEHNKYDLQRLRRDTINTIRPINATYYRVEVMLSNVNLTSFVKRIKECQFTKYVLLNLSQMNPNQFTYDDYFMIFNIPNLIAIDLSNNEVIDDNFILNLCSTIKRSKLLNLKAVLLNGCPKVTIAALKALQDLIDEGVVGCSLRLIESDFHLVNPTTYWRSFPGQNHLSTLPLGMKAFYSHSSKSIVNDGIKTRTESKFEKYGHSNKTAILDFHIGRGNFTPSNHVANKEYMTSAWKDIQRKNNNSRGYLYIKDANLHKVEVKKPIMKTEVKQEQIPDKENVSTVPTKRKLVKRLIKPNIKSFFAL
ncbi:hypothetical protein DFJ63DRAFT_118666 [Scheffersomyces coipomensis]|uniref:uncharacterized protein n=1 Tax=Scheffersomyces coipomensis TaxID=1788519 RepID=UPI00315D9B2F